MSDHVPTKSGLPAPGTLTAESWNQWSPVFARAALVRPMSAAAMVFAVGKSSGEAYVYSRAAGANTGHAAAYALLHALIPLALTMYVFGCAWWNGLAPRLAWELAIMHRHGRFWRERMYTNAELRVMVMWARQAL